MTTQDLINKLYGVETFANLNPVVSSLTSGAAKAAQLNPNRVGLVIVNLDTNVMYALTDNSVSSTKGIVIPANGGSLILDFKDDLQLVTFDWYLAGTGSGNFMVLENVIVS